MLLPMRTRATVHRTRIADCPAGSESNTYPSRMSYMIKALSLNVVCDMTLHWRSFPDEAACQDLALRYRPMYAHSHAVIAFELTRGIKLCLFDHIHKSHRLVVRGQASGMRSHTTGIKLKSL